jgi:EmrB/QacA subfamily drug resistance transporter
LTDFSIVNVALPSIQAALGFSQSSLQWIISAYALAFGGLLLLGGRAADLFGRRRLLISGLILFALASLGGGLAVDQVMLVLMRGIQGLAAAMIAPAALSLLTTNFDEGPPRQRALGVWGAVLGAGFVAGVVLGGVLTYFIDWRAVFFVNVPLALVTAIAIPMLFPQPSDRAEGRLDLPGAVLVTGAVVALVYALSEGNTVGWATAQTIGTLAGAVVLGAIFILVESKSSSPMVPLETFKLRALSVANLVNLTLIGSFAGYVLLLTLFLQQVHHYSPLVTGLTFLAAGAAGFTAGMVTPRLAAKVGLNRTLVLAAVVQAAGLAVLVLLPSRGTITFVACVAVVVNFADVVGIVMINVASTTGVPADRQGLAGGILNTSQQVGAALGVAILSTVAAAITKADPGQPHAAALVIGFRYALAVGAALSLLGAIMAWAGLRQRQPAPAPVGADTASAGQQSANAA